MSVICVTDIQWRLAFFLFCFCFLAKISSFAQSVPLCSCSRRSERRVAAEELATQPNCFLLDFRTCFRCLGLSGCRLQAELERILPLANGKTGSLTKTAANVLKTIWTHEQQLQQHCLSCHEVMKRWLTVKQRATKSRLGSFSQACGKQLIFSGKEQMTPAAELICYKKVSQ